MAQQLTLAQTALDAAERARRIHGDESHHGILDFSCNLCQVLQVTVHACRQAVASYSPRSFQGEDHAQNS